MKLFFEIFVLFVVVVTGWFVYQNYWDDLVYILFSDEPNYVLYIDDVALQVTVADNKEERIKGLSGVSSLGDFEGKLFIFDESNYHGIWMKDMRIPIDILWFNEDLELVDYKENVSPDSR